MFSDAAWRLSHSLSWTPCNTYRQDRSESGGENAPLSSLLRCAGNLALFRAGGGRRLPPLLDPPWASSSNGSWDPPCLGVNGTVQHLCTHLRGLSAQAGCFRGVHVVSFVTSRFLTRLQTCTGLTNREPPFFFGYGLMTAVVWTAGAPSVPVPASQC